MLILTLFKQIKRIIYLFKNQIKLLHSIQFHKFKENRHYKFPIIIE